MRGSLKSGALVALGALVLLAHDVRAASIFPDVVTLVLGETRLHWRGDDTAPVRR